ncbi:MAG TPA: type II and III secretion system protein [Bryobacteraceae bacterium]|nr:type II and III secretion system protein [Bryobacteraceae bacterium]
MKFCGLFCGFLMAVSAWGAVSAEQLFQQAKKAEHAGQTVQAYLLYAKAAAADPGNLSYWERAQALRPMASLLKGTQPVPADLAPEKIDRTLFGSIPDQDLEQARKPLPPPELKAPSGRQDFDLKADSKALWEQVAGAFHLTVIFDTAYQPVPALRLQLTGADYRDALRSLEAATNSFLTPVSERLIFVANDNPGKRTEFESTAAVVIPFPETISVQELQEISTGVRGTLDMTRLMVDTQRHLILVRDRVTKVRLAEKLLQDLLRPRAQVAIEVEILTTDQSSALSYGLSLQSSFQLVNFSTKKNLLSSIPSGVANFMTFGGGASLLGFGVTNAELFASVSKASASTVLNSEIVALDGLPSTLHVGDKYPLVTNSYIGNTSGGGTVFTPPPTFTFEDLGLVLKVTPHIHGADEVTLDIDAEFKLLGATSVDGIPVISSRKYESKTRVMTGEWAVLAGLMSSSEARTITGIPILSMIPLLRKNDINKDYGQTLIVLKPHLLIPSPSESPTWRAWSGTETKLPSVL